MKVYALIGGGGLLPKSWADTLTQHDVSFVPVGFRDITDASYVETYKPELFRLGSINKTLSYLRSKKVTNLIMVGYFTRPSFFSIFPDLKGFSWLLKLMSGGGDDDYLRRLAALLASEGFEVSSPDELVAEGLTLPVGCFTKLTPTETHLETISLGQQLLHALSPFDAAQAVALNKQHILGIEGPEGTKGLIERCAGYPNVKGATLIKFAKSGQDMRLDRPTIGPDTIDQLHAAGFAGMAIEANSCYVVDSQVTIEKANDLGLFLTAVENK